jgi:hypothetical protein
MTRLNTKLQAIQDKNLQDIVDKQTYIPTLGKVNNVNQVQNWLQKRIDLLIDLRDGEYTEQQIQNWIDFQYSRLNNDYKPTAQSILNGEDVEFSSEDEWEACVVFILFRFLTT